MTPGPAELFLFLSSSFVFSSSSKCPAHLRFTSGERLSFFVLYNGAGALASLFFFFFFSFPPSFFYSRFLLLLAT